MDEEHGEHFNLAHDAEEFRLRAKLHVVVRAWRRRAAQSVRNVPPKLRDLFPAAPIHAFQDAGFIQNQTLKVIRIKLVQLLVVCDYNAGTKKRRAGISLLNMDAVLLALLNRLTGHRKRG